MLGLVPSIHVLARLRVGKCRYNFVKCHTYWGKLVDGRPSPTMTVERTGVADDNRTVHATTRES
jgi:hypothetical protein